MNSLQTLLIENRITAEQIVRTIDHAILHPSLTETAIRADLQAVKSLPLASVCIKPDRLALAEDILQGGNVAALCTVIGFPHGIQLPDVKAFEAEHALENGATEIDMVINTGRALSGDWEYVREDIAQPLAAVRKYGGILKVIFETDFLEDDTVKIRLCELCSELQVDFVKTSTGFGYVKQVNGDYNYRGATEHDLKLMRQHCDSRVGIKASGGVRKLDDALMAIRCGCTRIGASASVALAAEANARFGGLENLNDGVKLGEGY